MANFQQLMNDEIRRLARKEIKIAFVQLAKNAIAMKKRIAELEKHVKFIEKNAQLPEVPVVKGVTVPAGAASVKLRVTGKRIKALRGKIGLSQAQFAAIVGVNLQSVNNWENGKSHPREEQKRKIVAIRDMGKKDLKKFLADNKIVVKKAKAAKKAVKKAVKAAAQTPAAAPAAAPAKA